MSPSLLHLCHPLITGGVSPHGLTVALLMEHVFGHVLGAMPIAGPALVFPGQRAVEGVRVNYPVLGFESLQRGWQGCECPICVFPVQLWGGTSLSSVS